MGGTSIDGSKNSNEPYVRTDAELAHQKRYEERERARAQSTIQIHYVIDERIPPKETSAMGSRNKRCWVVTRQVGEGRIEESRAIYNLPEAMGVLREHLTRDKRAGERLGVGIFHQTSTKRLT